MRKVNLSESQMLRIANGCLNKVLRESSSDNPYRAPFEKPSVKRPSIDDLEGVGEDEPYGWEPERTIPRGGIKPRIKRPSVTDREPESETGWQEDTDVAPWKKGSTRPESDPYCYAFDESRRYTGRRLY